MCQTPDPRRGGECYENKTLSFEQKLTIVNKNSKKEPTPDALDHRTPL
jgi:hypothetical protein